MGRAYQTMKPYRGGAIKWYLVRQSTRRRWVKRGEDNMQEASRWRVVSDKGGQSSLGESIEREKTDRQDGEGSRLER